MKKLRVCHIMTADLWAGAEVQVATAARYLAERPDVALTAVLFNEGWLAGELRRLGVDVAVVDERQHTASQMVRFIVRFLRDHDVELVHTHRYKDTILGSVAAKLAGGVRVIRTVHGLNEEMRGWDRVKLSAYVALDTTALRCVADRLIAVSADMADRLRRSWLWPSRVTAIPNAVDLRAVRAARPAGVVRDTLGIGAGELVIGTAGRLAPVKGHIYLVRAAQLIRQQEPRVRFVFAGSGPLRSELTEAADALGIGDACMFVDPGIDARLGIYDLIAAMDLFVLPSLDEGLPMALLEAMALGRPVVAAAVGGVPEIITHRTTGLLVEPGNHRQIAEACLALVLDRQWAQGLAARGRQVVEQRFSHEKNGRALIDVYREVTGARGTVGSGADAPALLMGIFSGVRRIQTGARERARDVRRRIACARERCRMARIRRQPAALGAMLRSATSILVVCHGNIIRSPFAAHLMEQLSRSRTPVSITCAGMEATAGKQADRLAIAAAAPLGVDLRGHVAAPITPALVSAADVIFVMDAFQLVAMRERFPQARARTFLLASLCPGAPLEIRDPFGGDASQFQECYGEISRAVRAVVAEIYRHRSFSSDIDRLLSPPCLTDRNSSCHEATKLTKKIISQ